MIHGLSEGLIGEVVDIVTRAAMAASRAVRKGSRPAPSWRSDCAAVTAAELGLAPFNDMTSSAPRITTSPGPPL